MSVQPFPLYNELKDKVKGLKPLSEDDFQLLGQQISGLSAEEQQVVSAIILHHLVLELDGKKGKAGKDLKGASSKIPYRGKTFAVGKGAMWKFSNLPDELNLILSVYIRSTN